MSSDADWPEDEARGELVLALLREELAKGKRRGTKWDQILKDPKAYFTKEEDWKRAQQNEKHGWDLSQIPKLNENG